MRLRLAIILAPLALTGCYVSSAPGYRPPPDFVHIRPPSLYEMEALARDHQFQQQLYNEQNAARRGF